MIGMTVSSLSVGDVRLTRVSYAEIDVPPEAVSVTAEAVQSIPWAAPQWANGSNPRVAAAAWIIEHDGMRIVVDPAQAADDILRNDNDAAFHQEAFAKLLADAGFARESITHTIATHEDGIGMFAWRNDDGSWSPFFPNAPMLISQRELDAIDRGEHPSDGSRAQATASKRRGPPDGGSRADHRRGDDRAHRCAHARPPDRPDRRERRTHDLRRSPRGRAVASRHGREPQDGAATRSCIVRARVRSARRRCVAHRSVVARARRGPLGRHQTRTRVSACSAPHSARGSVLYRAGVDDFERAARDRLELVQVVVVPARVAAPVMNHDEPLSATIIP